MFNFKAGSSLNQFVPQEILEGAFILKTCQRSLALAKSPSQNSLDIPTTYPSGEVVFGEQAYLYLLEIICGLKSKLLGENEIVAQFKQAYHDYLGSDVIDTQVLRVLEKLFKDAKKIRTDYLRGLCQKTYASISRKKMLAAKADQILILGSGQLCEDLINQFKKKLPVTICARNSKRVQELKQQHDISVHSWENLSHTHQYPFIINTIGTKGELIGKGFFSQHVLHTQKLFIDLAHPSPICTHHHYTDHIIGLGDILEEGAASETQKKNQVAKAQKAMEQLVSHRQQNFLKLSKQKKHFAGQSRSQYA